MKICNKCNIEKSSDDFPRVKKGLDKRKSYCKSCSRISKMNWRHNNVEKVRNGQKQYRLNNLEREREKDRNRERKIDKEKSKQYKLKARYNITIEQYNELYNNQNGCCAICGTHQLDVGKTLAVDHNHITGEIRGLLCMLCNTALGKFNDDIELLKSAINYLITNERYIQKEH